MKVCVFDTSQNRPDLSGLDGPEVVSIAEQCRVFSQREIFADADLVLIHTSEASANDASQGALKHAPGFCLHVHYTDDRPINYFEQNGNVITCSHVAVSTRARRMVEKALLSGLPFDASILRFDCVKAVSCIIQELFMRSLAFRIQLQANRITGGPSSCKALRERRASSIWPEENSMTFMEFMTAVLKEKIPGEDQTLAQVVASLGGGRNVEWPNASAVNVGVGEQQEELEKILEAKTREEVSSLNDWIDRLDTYLRGLRGELQK